MEKWEKKDKEARILFLDCYAIKRSIEDSVALLQKKTVFKTRMIRLSLPTQSEMALQLIKSKKYTLLEIKWSVWERFLSSPFFVNLRRNKKTSKFLSIFLVGVEYNFIPLDNIPKRTFPWDYYHIEVNLHMCHHLHHNHLIHTKLSVNYLFFPW